MTKEEASRIVWGYMKEAVSFVIESKEFNEGVTISELVRVSNSRQIPTQPFEALRGSRATWEEAQV